MNKISISDYFNQKRQDQQSRAKKLQDHWELMKTCLEFIEQNEDWPYLEEERVKKWEKEQRLQEVWEKKKKLKGEKEERSKSHSRKDGCSQKAGNDQ